MKKKDIDDEKGTKMTEWKNNDNKKLTIMQI